MHLPFVGPGSWGHPPRKTRIDLFDARTIRCKSSNFISNESAPTMNLVLQQQSASTAPTKTPLARGKQVLQAPKETHDEVIDAQGGNAPVQRVGKHVGQNLVEEVAGEPQLEVQALLPENVADAQPVLLAQADTPTVTPAEVVDASTSAVAAPVPVAASGAGVSSSVLGLVAVGAGGGGRGCCGRQG